MKIKHIIALCLVFALVLPSTALAAGNHAKNTAKVNINVAHPRPLTVTVHYTLTGAKEKFPHTWNFGDGFKCHCIHRTHTYKHHGTYTISLTAKTTTGKILKAYKKVTV